MKTVLWPHFESAQAAPVLQMLLTRFTMSATVAIDAGHMQCRVCSSLTGFTKPSLHAKQGVQSVRACPLHSKRCLASSPHQVLHHIIYTDSNLYYCFAVDPAPSLTHTHRQPICISFTGQSKGCLLECLTPDNSWLEVYLKRRGQQAAWEPLHESMVPNNILAAFVRETFRTKAIPIPGDQIQQIP